MAAAAAAAIALLLRYSLQRDAKVYSRHRYCCASRGLKDRTEDIIGLLVRSPTFSCLKRKSTKKL